jgi:hypothetical protein
MSQRNYTRKAAIWLLKELCKPPKVKITGIVTDGKRKEINVRTYEMETLKTFIEYAPYSAMVLRDACELLARNGHIYMFDNEHNRYDIEIQGRDEGNMALKEDFYQEDIANHFSEKMNRTTRWFLPILSFLVALFSLGYSIVKDKKNVTTMDSLQQQINQLNDSIKNVKLKK